MKIVNIIQRYHPAIGGSETWCRGICQYLSQKGEDVTVLTMNVFNEEEYWHEPSLDNCPARLGALEYDGKVLVKRYRRTKIRPLVFAFLKFVLDKKFRIYFYGPHSLEMYLRMIKEIKKADIVHLHTMPYPHNFVGYFFARFFGKKVVLTPHFHPGHDFYERPKNYWLMNRCDLIFAVSDYEREYFINKGISADRIFVAYNAIDPPDYRPADLAEYRKRIFEQYGMHKDTKIVLFVGRKIEYKGIDTLVESVMGIKDMDVRLILIGPDFPWFSKFYSGLPEQKKKQIIDLGIVSHQEKVNLLHLCNVLALPSKHEAFGIVFLEAWICEKPVIGTDEHAIRQLLDGCGLTVPYGSVEALRKKIKIILSNTELSMKMAKNGKMKVLKYYTWEKIGAKIDRLLKELRQG